MNYFVLSILFMLSIVMQITGCSGINNTKSGSEQYVTQNDIKPYIEQWDTSKDKIAHLSNMEQDLAMLIQALALHTNINDLPTTLRAEKPVIAYGSKEQTEHIQKPKTSVLPKNIKKPQTVTTSEPELPTLQSNSLYGVSLGTFFVKRAADNQLKRIHSQYPLIFSSLQYRIAQETKSTSTRYHLIAGPLKSSSQAEQLCAALKPLLSSCTPTKFRGQLPSNV